MSSYKSKHTGPKIDEAVERANGYGLGSGNGKSISNCNDAVQSGWYVTNGNTTNGPVNPANSAALNYLTLLVSSGAERIRQIAFVATQNYYTVATRYSSDSGSSWSEWEWVNPPMVAGVEYRTTEGFEGKPVYCQLVYFTGIVDGGTFTVDVPNVDIVLRFFGSRSGVPLPFISEKGLSNVWTNYFSVNRSTNKITIVMNAGSSVPSDSRFYCALYYTKNA